MLSFVYWLSRNFERSHGVKPNVLYINRVHFERLCQEFSDPHDPGAVMKLLGLTIMISEDALHPHLANIDRPARSGPARGAATVATHAQISRLPTRRES